MQKNTLTGVVPPAEMKGSRSPSRKMKTYPRSCVIRARFYRALEKAQHESQRLEQALWSQNHAGSMWVLPQTLQELCNLRQLCRLQSNALARARQLVENERSIPLREPMENIEAAKCDRCGTKAPDMVLALCFHRLCRDCDGAGIPGASDNMFQTCKICFLYGGQQPRRT